MLSSRIIATVAAAVLATVPLLPGPASALADAPDPGGLERLPLTGLRVAIDPGHNGANASHPAQINRLVPDGRGGRKACNTTGTSTRAGYPEHAAVWDVALRARRTLRDLGASVTLTRRTDHGVGPCVNRRGRWPQRHRADVLVSLHANGSTNRSVRGMHVNRSWPPLSHSQRQPSRRLAVAMLAAFGRADLPINRSYGAGGLVGRADLATLNHARRPAVLVELAEMRNRRGARLLGSRPGRDRLARAVVSALRRWAV